MSDNYPIYGDTHNFGQSVSKVGNWVIKPRTVFWEWLFLSKESPIRKTFNQLNYQNENFNPFVGYPEINFNKMSSEAGLGSGQVEFFKVDSPIDNESLQEFSQAIGATLATSLFFGISDLHYKNIVSGKKKNRIYFFPIDIETVFEPLAFISQSYLLKSKYNWNDIVGIKSAITGKVDVCDIVRNFIETVELLNTYTDTLNRILSKLPINSIPIRRILKPTKNYIEYLMGYSKKTNYFKEEVEQLARGDVPYFFSYAMSNKLWYLSNEGLQISQIEWDNAYPISWSFFEQQKEFVNEVLDEKIKISTLQIARSFDIGTDKTYRNTSCEVTYDSDKIYLKYPTKGWKLRCCRLDT